MDDTLVTVIVAAYNSSRTIDETLRGIRSQSHTALEILVVDDGSTDDTSAIVRRHAAVDPRIRLIRQANAGVAATRNRGIAEARGLFVAPIDGDDLWAPTKIAEQVAVMHAGGPRIGLVYTWSVMIDAESLVTGKPHARTEAGDVLQAICRSNLLGNGSAALVRTDVARAAGGFDTRLRALRAEGCEDIAFYIRVAEQHHFGVVPKPLTGYRQLPNSMSDDGLRMYRSWALVAAEVAARNPQCRAALAACTRDMTRWTIARDSKAKRYRALLAFLRMHPIILSGKLAGALGRRIQGQGRRLADHWSNDDERNPRPPDRFPIGEPPPT